MDRMQWGNSQWESVLTESSESFDEIVRRANERTKIILIRIIQIKFDPIFKFSAVRCCVFVNAWHQNQNLKELVKYSETLNISNSFFKRDGNWWLEKFHMWICRDKAVYQNRNWVQGLMQALMVRSRTWRGCCRVPGRTCFSVLGPGFLPVVRVNGCSM